MTPEQRSKTFHSILNRSGVKAAVNFITSVKKGGVLMPDDIDQKSGKTVKDALESKHPEARDPDARYSME